MFGRKLISSVALASLFAFAVPSIALADDGARDARGEEARGQGKGHGKGKGKGLDKAFPMPAAKFQEHADKRMAKVRARVTERLDQKGVTPEKRKEVLAKLDAGQAKVKAAVAEATKDGTVTKDEAMKVRNAAKEVRKELGMGHGGKGKGHGKGKAKGKHGGTEA